METKVESTSVDFDLLGDFNLIDIFLDATRDDGELSRYRKGIVDFNQDVAISIKFYTFIHFYEN